MDRVDEIFGGDDEPIAAVVESLDPTASSLESDTAAEASGDEAQTEEVAAESQEGAESETKPESTPAPVTPPAKQYKFKAGEQEVPLDENAVIEHRVDGKLEKIALKDLVQNYAGVIPVQKRFAELDKVRKQDAQRIQEFENVRTRHASLITDMHTRVQKGDVFGAVANMLEMAGSKADPRQFVSELRRGLAEQAQKLAGMTEEQRAVLEAQEERQYLQSRYDRLLQQRNQEQAQLAYRERVSGAMQSVNATLEQYSESKKWLEDAYRAKGQDVAQITPETVASHIKNVRDYETARNAMTEVDPELVKDDKLWDHAVYLLRQNPTWTQEDLRDVFKQAADQKRGSTVSKKVSKAPVATVAGAAAKAKAAPITDKQKQKALQLAQKVEGYGGFDASDLEW